MTTDTTDSDNETTTGEPTLGSPTHQGASKSDAPASDTSDPDTTDQDRTDERRLRRRAQAAEAERDTLATRLEGLQMAEVMRQLDNVLAVPGDLFELTDTTLDDVTDPHTGAVDANKVTAAVDALLERRPGLKFIPDPPAPRPGTYMDAGQGRGYVTPQTRTGWDRVLG